MVTPQLPPGDYEMTLRSRQPDGAYLAYADHEIGRVIQEVGDLGELDNTVRSDAR
jgi:arylsulfatase A-like enzyme